MFKANDKFLKIASIILTVLVGVIICLGVLIFLILFNENIVKSAVFVLIFSLLSSFILWLFGNLWLSYLCDIKLIRNKLYGIHNLNTNIYLTSEDEYEIQNQINSDKINQDKNNN